MQVAIPRIESLQRVTSATGNEAGGLTRALQRAKSSAAVPKCQKLGSLQRFVEHKCDAGEMSASHFSADNVHRIGVLDIRLLNCDRHSGNLLVCEGGGSGAGSFAAPYTLVPIDHGYALPEALDNPYFEWLFWPQTSVPFSDAVKEYVANLDVQADIALLREKVPSLRDECLRCLEVTTKVRPLRRFPQASAAPCLLGGGDGAHLACRCCNSQSRQG